MISERSAAPKPSLPAPDPSVVSDHGWFDAASTTDGCQARIRVSGELDIATRPGFEATIQSVLSGGATMLEVDLVDVTFLDSSGVDVLHRTVRALLERGGHLVVTNASGPVRRVLDITGFTTLCGATVQNSCLEDEATLKTEVRHLSL